MARVKVYFRAALDVQNESLDVSTEYIPHNPFNAYDDVPVGVAEAERPPVRVEPVVEAALPTTTGPSRGGTWWDAFWTDRNCRRTNSLLISLIVHACGLIALAMAMHFVTQRQPPPEVIVYQFDRAPTLQELSEVDVPEVEFDGAATALTFDSPRMLHVPEALDIPSPVAGQNASAPQLELLPQAPNAIPLQDLFLTNRLAAGGGFEGRESEARARLLAERGGTPESEDAVARALAWLAAHQRADGSWRFDIHDGPCDGRCQNPGTIGSTTGATGLALLPFLGAGHTHSSGAYQDVVARGVYYLSSRMLKTPHGGDLQEGTMYAQGIATLALCEVYAMTRDPALREPAQQAVDFICYAQHKKGGWRYFPGQPGDTTVFGWQLMALKSARLAGLFVPSPVIELAKEYLDSVQVEAGAYYGYQLPRKEATPTAVGVLSRMYLGWPRNHDPLITGVHYLSDAGPSRRDMYFNYYATQVLAHYGGPRWESWNEQLRETLIKTQSTRGHENGSWYFHDRHAIAGGRLYTTAVCAMILEVYYRHMPLYGLTVVDEGF